MKYFKDSDGDYLVIDETTFDGEQYEGRSTVILGDPSSLATGAISPEYLKGCKVVLRKYVPVVWLKGLVSENSFQKEEIV